MNDLVLNGKTLLVVDDEADLRDIVASELEFMGSKVFQAENIKVAEDLLKSNKIDLVVSDIRMPGGTGVDLLDSIKHRNVKNPPIILITGFADITLEDALDKGAEAIMHKPFRLDDLIQTVVKYTDPVEKRLSQTIETSHAIEFRFKEKLQEKMDKNEFFIGRGGISILIHSNGKKITVGDHVRFSLEFADKKLSGAATCRSFKFTTPEGGEAALGLEFENLDGSTLDFFLNYWHNNQIIPFIPAIKYS